MITCLLWANREEGANYNDEQIYEVAEREFCAEDAENKIIIRGFYD